eukprot:5318268-Alexandrium_andersonii.AAC.1
MAGRRKGDATTGRLRGRSLDAFGKRSQCSSSQGRSCTPDRAPRPTLTAPAKSSQCCPRPVPLVSHPSPNRNTGAACATNDATAGGQ